MNNSPYPDRDLSGINSIVATLAPEALIELAEAAAELFAGRAFAIFEIKPSTFADAFPRENAATIWEDTSLYVSNHFRNNFYYCYNEMTSTPPAALAGTHPIGADLNVVAWDPASDGQRGVVEYVSDVFERILDRDEALGLAEDLSRRLETRFLENNTSWIPLVKRYHFASGRRIDLQMLTAAGYDAGNDIVAVATFAFVAYTTKVERRSTLFTPQDKNAMHTNFIVSTG